MEITDRSPVFDGDDPQPRLADVIGDNLVVEELTPVLERANTIASGSSSVVECMEAYVALIGSMDKPPPEVHRMLCEASACEAMHSERHTSSIVDMFSEAMHRILGRLLSNCKEHGDRRLFCESTSTLGSAMGCRRGARL